MITNQPHGTAANVGTTVWLTVGASGSEPLSYRWQFNGTNLDWAGSTNVLALVDVTTNDSGSYWVIVTNLAGSATSQAAVLVVGYQALTPAHIWLLTHFGTNGDFLSIALEAGKNYRVQSSINLQTWMDVTNFLSSSDLMCFTNNAAANKNQLFYRTVSP